MGFFFSLTVLNCCVRSPGAFPCASIGICQTSASPLAHIAIVVSSDPFRVEKLPQQSVANTNDTVIAPPLSSPAPLSARLSDLCCVQGLKCQLNRFGALTLNRQGERQPRGERIEINLFKKSGEKRLN